MWLPVQLSSRNFRCGNSAAKRKAVHKHAERNEPIRRIVLKLRCDDRTKHSPAAFRQHGRKVLQ